MVGLGMVVFYMVDTAAQTWGAIYLDDVLDAPSRWVALATLPYLTASLVVRLAGDRLVHAVVDDFCGEVMERAVDLGHGEEYWPVLLKAIEDAKGKV